MQLLCLYIAMELLGFISSFLAQLKYIFLKGHKPITSVIIVCNSRFERSMEMTAKSYYWSYESVHLYINLDMCGNT